MYNAHRLGQQPANRLNELLDQVRAEFDNQQNRSGECEAQVSAQMQEMEMIRQKIYSLEQSQLAIKARYEEEVGRLRHELELRGGPPANHIGGPPHNQPPHQQPPNIGSGQGNLFGGIMAPTGSSGPGLAPPPQDQQQGPAPHQISQAQAGPPPPPQPPFGGYPQQPVNGYNSNGPQPNSPNPNKRGQGRVPPGPNTPQQSQQAPYQDARGSPQMARPTPPPPQASRIPDVGNQLADLHPDMLPPNLKREGDDWYAIFNPRVKRDLDVELVHSLEHKSVVCCVRFSHDGRYVATGCNRAAQIYEVHTGNLVTCLQDDGVDKDGDLYIRSVCFNPDGRYLATGAEDKMIRVWDIRTKQIKTSFSGHEQDIYSLDFSQDGRHIASGSGDRTVRVWDIETGEQTICLPIDDGVTTVAMSPSGTTVAAGSLDKSVRVWDTRTGQLYEKLDGLEGHKDSVYSVAFSPSGRELVSGSLDRTIKMWQLGNGPGPMISHNSGNGKCIKTFEGHKDFVLSVALTPDGQWVLSGSKDRGVQFWSRNGEAQLMLQGHKNSVISVAPSPRREETGTSLFATGSGDMHARIWRYKQYVG